MTTLTACVNLCVHREPVQPIATLLGEFLINTFDDKDEGKSEEKYQGINKITQINDKRCLSKSDLSIS